MKLNQLSDQEAKAITVRHWKCLPKPKCLKSVLYCSELAEIRACVKYALIIYFFSYFLLLPHIYPLSVRFPYD